MLIDEYTCRLRAASSARARGCAAALAPPPAASRAFRLSSEAKEEGLHLIIVRHGQSTNNLIQLEVERRMRDEGLPASEAAAIWMSERVHDPALSDKGQQEGCTFAPLTPSACLVIHSEGPSRLVAPPAVCAQGTHRTRHPCSLVRGARAGRVSRQGPGPRGARCAQPDAARVGGVFTRSEEANTEN